MNISGLVAVSGKPGLYKLIGQNKSGFILESLDEQKNKLVVNISTAKLASLEDITIYGEDEDLKLKDVFENIKAFKGTVPQSKEDAKVLRKFFLEIAPDHDEEKVYHSDIKKILSWYHIIKELPLFNEESESIAEPKAEEKEDAEVLEPVKKEKSKTAKKTATPKNSAPKEG